MSQPHQSSSPSCCLESLERLASAPVPQMSLYQSKQQSLAVTAAEVLKYDNRRLRNFFKENNSSLPDFLQISKAERYHLSKRFRVIQSNSPDAEELDVNELAKRLMDVAAKPGRYQSDEYPRSSTKSTEHSPSPADIQDREDLCRQELVADGGYPVGTKQELLDFCAQPEISCPAILAWLSDEPDTETGARELATMFSRQFERWCDFRKSQWQNRADGNGRGDSGEEAFPAYLDAKTRIYKGSGATRLVADDSFQVAVRRQWQAMSASRQLTEKRSFLVYKDAVQMRIGRYHFGRRLELLDDIPRQGSWTTLLEYLNYEVWHLEQLTVKAESLEPTFFACRKLLSDGELDRTPAADGRHFATRASSLDDVSDASQADHDTYRARIGAIRLRVGPYLKARYAAYRQRLRVDWVVQLARSMETKMSQQRENITAAEALVTQKRQREDPQRGTSKRRATGAHSSSRGSRAGYCTGTRRSARLANSRLGPSTSRNLPK